MEKRLASALPVRRKKKSLGKLKVTARTPKAAFLKAVEKTKEYIASGDVFQCVLSQRFDCVPGVDAFDIYRALRIVNPSPYMYLMRLGDCDVIGASPEVLVTVDGEIALADAAGHGLAVDDLELHVQAEVVVPLVDDELVQRLVAGRVAGK